MPVSGLIVTLSSSEAHAESARAWLKDDPRFELGAASSTSSRRMPVVVDTPNSNSDKQCWTELQAHAGIEFVDVVCVYFAEPQPDASSAHLP